VFFAGRQKNMTILHAYVNTLLKEKIIDQYHIFDFSRNSNDKSFLFDSYQQLNTNYPNQIYLHNYHENDFKLIKT